MISSVLHLSGKRSSYVSKEDLGFVQVQTGKGYVPAFLHVSLDRKVAVSGCFWRQIVAHQKYHGDCSYELNQHLDVFSLTTLVSVPVEIMNFRVIHPSELFLHGVPFNVDSG